jgi:hypothetical protein
MRDSVGMIARDWMRSENIGVVIANIDGTLPAGPVMSEPQLNSTLHRCTVLLGRSRDARRWEPAGL